MFYEKSYLSHFETRSCCLTCLSDFENQFLQMDKFYEQIRKKNVFPCDFKHNFRDEICMLLNTHWILRDLLQSYWIVTELVGGLWMKYLKPT